MQLGHVLLAIKIGNLEITPPYQYGLHTIFTLRSENQFSGARRAIGEHLVEVLESLRKQYVVTGTVWNCVMVDSFRDFGV
jgi:hypothetical protein